MNQFNQKNLVSQWIADKRITCPQCHRSSLTVNSTSVQCSSCQAFFDINNNVPDFFQISPKNNHQDSIKIQESQAEIEELSESIIKAIELDESSNTRRLVIEILERALSYQCDVPSLKAEITDLLDRFVVNQNLDINLNPVLDANCDALIDYERHYFRESYFEKQLTENSIAANVRIKNAGQFPWCSHDPCKRGLMGQWVDTQGHTQPAGFSQFPVPIEPDRSISLPLCVDNPGPGPWILKVGLADDGNFINGAKQLDIPIKIYPYRRRHQLKTIFYTLSSHWRLSQQAQVFPSQSLSYAEDHRLGVQMIHDWISQQSSQSRFKIVEIGSGTHPQTAWNEKLEVLAIDISLPLLELGSLYFGDRFPERLGFICADAMNLPLAPKSLDAIAIFSALHHFSEPEKLLSQLSHLLKAGGVIFVMCEPVGSSLESPETVRDLLKGINEQVFSLEEYQLIFEKAGLKPQVLRVDGSSLKAILKSRR